ncbi:MAG: beta-CASP ribonuclease aCPSF1 [Candidatus Woesearchaeota archaeon]
MKNGNNSILKEVMTHIPEDKISDAGFEGANIVLYTKDKDFFFNNNGLIKEIVDDIKKRVELRPDPSITMEMEKAEKKIKSILPKESNVAQIIFDPQRSRVIIEAEKPGIAIGKHGSLLKEIKEKTLWMPYIRRTPAIRSKLIENIRSVLYEHSDYRRKFLNKIGHRIYDGWKRGKKDEWVRMTFLGGARQVGRSSLLMQTQESRVLLDCGVDVTKNDSSGYPHLDIPEFNINELDAVIVSHSHIDHTGFLPYLFKYGYRGPVYCTAPTRDVMSLLLLDFIKIMHQDRKEPLFEVDDVKEMVKHTVTLQFEEVTDITPDLRITLYNSGHILGAAMIHIHIGNGLHNLLYTGDIKYAKTNLLDPAATVFPRLETMIIEATYGGKENLMPNIKEEDTSLRQIIIETIKRGGKVLMPVLGSGKAQEVMMIVANLVKNKEIDEVPVFIDGMVWDVTAIHTAYPEFLNSSVRKQIFHKDNNPFLMEIFKRVGSQKERKQIIEETGPCVIMATSGMLQGGPSVEYLKQLGDNPKNSLVLTCYQGEGSLGRKIENGEKEITFKDGQREETLILKIEYHKLVISNHSDRKELMSFISRCQPRPKKVIVNHGENSRCLDLSSSIHKQFRIETTAPRNMETVRIK